jgi:hypothetical protein
MTSSAFRRAVPALLLAAGTLVSPPGCGKEPPPAHALLPELVAVVHEMQTEMAALQREMGPATQGNPTEPTADNTDPASPPTGQPTDIENLGRELTLLRTGWLELRNEVRSRMEARDSSDQKVRTHPAPDGTGHDEPPSIAPMPDENASPRELRQELLRLRRQCALQEQIIAEQEKRYKVLRTLSGIPAPFNNPEAKQDDAAGDLLRRMQEKFQKLQERFNREEKKNEAKEKVDKKDEKQK